MVIDFHVHPAQWNWRTPGFDRYLGETWSPEELSQLEQQCQTGAGLAAYLRSSGVDAAVILAEDTPATTGVVSNEDVLRLCAGDAMLIPFGTLHPHMSHDLPGLLSSLADRGIRGIKLYPTYNFFYPNDPVLYPMYAKAEQLSLPIMVHTGTSVFPGSRVKYGNPLCLDDVAVDFPGLTILLSHAGRPFWHAEAAFLARLHANIHLDIAGLPPKNLLKYLPDTPRLYSKMVFGSDWPGVGSIADNISAIRGLPLSEEARDLILGGNAARILRLGDDGHG